MGKDELKQFLPQVSFWEKSRLEYLIPNKLGFVLY